MFGLNKSMQQHCASVQFSFTSVAPNHSNSRLKAFYNLKCVKEQIPLNIKKLWL